MEQTRRSWLRKIGLLFAGIAVIRSNASALAFQNDHRHQQFIKETGYIKPGAFSVSLNVKDIHVSKQFYEDLGFKVFAGDLKKNYLIMKNGNALIGLFYGMFEKTILTFNPGWDENAQKMETFDDVRAIQQSLKQKGIKLLSEADEKTSGPASIMLTDPDGNQILFDQHA